MKIEKWNKIDKIFIGQLDDIYKTLDYCDVYFIADKGYAVINRAPKYQIYQRLNIPEIQDVFVMPSDRGQGIAAMLIHYLESISKAESIGISVPVSHVYGVAQRLYIKLGYIPDGNGVTYEREPVAFGTTARLDDNLCLMMVKDLKSN